MSEFPAVSSGQTGDGLPAPAIYGMPRRLGRHAHGSIRTTIGTQLRLAREEASMSVDDLAAKTGISPERIRQYEAGTRGLHPKTLHRFSQAVNRPIRFLLGAAEV